MTEVGLPTVKCGECEAELQEPSNLTLEQRQPCPVCGSKQRALHISISETIHAHEMIGLKAKNSSGGRPFMEQKVGDDLHRKSGKQYLLSMSRIAGTPLSDNPLNEGLVEQLASVLAACHQSYEFSCFGSLTGELLIEDAQDEFGEFLINQLQKWTSRLTEFSTQYAEVVAILARLAEQHHASLNRFVPAVFSHNDFDLKNVLHVRGKIVGLIDWEHAGAYPFAWEMRKLYPALYWEKSDWSTQFQTRYLSQCPKTAMPNTSEQALLVAVDCIGALSWAYRKRTQSEVDRIRQLLNKALAMLSKGVSNE